MYTRNQAKPKFARQSRPQKYERPAVNCLFQAYPGFTSFCRDQSGVGLLEVALLLPLLLLLLVGAADLGRAACAAIEVSAAAAAGAEFGTHYPENAAGMQQAALLYGGDLQGLTANATWGCECADGTSAIGSCSPQPSCSTNVIQYVLVTTSITYRPLLHYPGLPTSFSLGGHARLRSVY